MSRNIHTRVELERSRIARAIAGLEEVIRRHPDGDVVNASAAAALGFLKMRADEQWPFAEFRDALENLRMDRATRRQRLIECLDAIKHAIHEK